MKMKNFTTAMTVPQAFITKNKQRLKQHGNTVYLSNGDEFEIELFNPTQNVLLAKFKINGTLIDGGGLVINPGQRVFLERYLTETRKFKYDTYTVESSEVVKTAITNNGLVEILFYEEDTYNTNIVYGYPSSWTYTDNTFVARTDSGAGKLYSSNFTTTSNTFFNKEKVLDQKSLKKQDSDLSFTNSITMDWMETGRVEKGSESNQHFNYVDKKFKIFTSTVVTWYILPESQKPVEYSDLKQYCTECGAKRKKDNHKFCPHCGTKF